MVDARILSYLCCIGLNSQNHMICNAMLLRLTLMGFCCFYFLRLGFCFHSASHLIRLEVLLSHKSF
jgi:hypothetical protein